MVRINELARYLVKNLKGIFELFALNRILLSHRHVPLFDASGAEIDPLQSVNKKHAKLLFPFYTVSYDDYKNARQIPVASCVR